MAPDNNISKEGRVQLALDAYKKGLFKSISKTASAYDVPPTTLKRRVKGIPAREDSIANNRKLTNTEESTLLAWILDLDQHSLPPQISTVHYLAQSLLSAQLSSEATISEKWVNCYIKHHTELCSKYS